MLGGLTLFCLGIVAIYLSKVFKETKGRPYTIVRQVYDRRADVR
jgi:putative glycosyltransferase